jgi:N-acetyl-gamma-glutamyl-phosphate reductase
VKRHTVALAGASGYTGMEVLRIAISHPAIAINELYGASSAGKTIQELVPAFEGYYDLVIGDIATIIDTKADAVILALPHGESAPVVDALLAKGYKGKIVDIGSDHRADCRTIYGLVEAFRDSLVGADFVANPGCFATAIQLGVKPLSDAGVVDQVFVTGVTGSSGSGATPSATTHSSTRIGNLKAYKVFEHQHLDEVRHTVGVPVHFVPVSGPFVRGIWITIQATLKQDADVDALFAQAYASSPMVRLRQGLPELKPIIGTNFADIGWVKQGNHVVIGVAIDNLGKGAAGQALQNLNLMLGLPETTGLLTPPQLL